jgi:hypothetical protein
MPATTPTTEDRVHVASQHLYEALTHRFGPLDLGAHQPLVKAVSEYGTASRRHDDAAVQVAGQHVYEALTHHFGPLDLSARQPIVIALAEYGAACRDAGTDA